MRMLRGLSRNVKSEKRLKKKKWKIKLKIWSRNRKNVSGVSNKWLWQLCWREFRETGMNSLNTGRSIRKDWYRGTRICYLIYWTSRIWKRGGLISFWSLHLGRDRQRGKVILRVDCIQHLKRPSWSLMQKMCRQLTGQCTTTISIIGLIVLLRL